MFTWLPGYHELKGLERARMSKTLNDWYVSIHSGEFHTTTNPEMIKSGGVPLIELDELLQELPADAAIYWHVGWWLNPSGLAAPSEFMLPSDEHQDWVRAKMDRVELPLSLSKGDI